MRYILGRLQKKVGITIEESELVIFAFDIDWICNRRVYRNLF